MLGLEGRDPHILGSANFCNLQNKLHVTRLAVLIMHSDKLLLNNMIKPGWKKWGERRKILELNPKTVENLCIKNNNK